MWIDHWTQLLPVMHKILDEERLDLTSCSDAYARRRCLGRTHLIRTLRKEGKLEPPEQTADARSGEQVHLAWSGQKGSLDKGQTQTLLALRRLEHMVVANWSAGQSVCLLNREERLWLHEGLEPIHSGRYDVAYQTLDRKRMLIIDGKTLYGQVESAEINDQLRELVALARHNYPNIEEFTVALLQPNVARRVDVAAYDWIEAELALRLLRQHLSDIRDPYHQRNPGPYCKFCPAALHCPEAKNSIITVSESIKEIQAGDYDLPLGPRGAMLLARIRTAKPLLEIFESAYKAALAEDPGAIPNWRLRDGKNVRRIADIEAAWALAQKRGITLADFLECVEVSVGELEEIFGRTTAAKGKALHEEFNEFFGAAIERVQYAKELEEIK
jgi:hypothetical protein